MIKLLAFLILVPSLAWGFPSFQMNFAQPGAPPAVPASCSTANIILWLNFENCATNPCTAYTFDATDEYTAGADNTLSFNNTAAVNQDADKYGTYGLDLPVSLDWVQTDTPLATIDDAGRVGFWVYITSWPASSNATIFQLYTTSNNYARISLQASDTGYELMFVWRDSATSRTNLITTSSGMTTATWYFVEASWDTTANEREIFVDGVSKGSSSETIGSFYANVASIYIGATVSAVGTDMHVDNLILGSSPDDDFYTVCKDELTWPGF